MLLVLPCSHSDLPQTFPLSAAIFNKLRAAGCMNTHIKQKQNTHSDELSEEL